MKKTLLTDYLKIPGVTQTSLAAALRCRQSAISNIIRSDRITFVIEGDDGSIELREDKLIAPKTT